MVSGGDASGTAVDLSIVMPVYNELATVRQAIEEVVELELPIRTREIVVVDDGSTDGTRDLLGTADWPPEVRVVLHEQNHGKDAAVQTGLARAQGRFAIVVDADLELDVSDVAALLPPLLSGEARAVFGARRFPKDSARKLRYWIGNWGVTTAANILYRQRISDVMTCYKAMPTELFRSLALRERGFGIEPEIAARLMQAGVTIHEIPVSYEPRARKEGKKLTMVDGLRVLRTLIRCRVSSGLRESRYVAASELEARH